MWNSKTELAKKSLELAKMENPDNFRKSDVIACSKEVYGGFGHAVAYRIHKPIKSMKDVHDMGNAMANIDGHYPVGMPGCYVVGLNGDCGIECPVYLEGDCNEPKEMIELLETDKERKLHNDLYGYA